MVDGKKVDGLNQHGTVYEVGTINDDKLKIILSGLMMLMIRFNLVPGMFLPRVFLVLPQWIHCQPREQAEHGGTQGDQAQGRGPGEE